MPIKPENRDRYPDNWPEIRARILKRANDKCEFCRVENYSILARGVDFGKNPPTVHYSKVVLTVAHLDHEPENCSDDNLKALCQKCHLEYDRSDNQKKAAETRRQKKGNVELFAVSFVDDPPIDACRKENQEMFLNHSMRLMFARWVLMDIINLRIKQLKEGL